MTKRLHQKVVLITGAAQGIGAATAKLFVEEGATVILSDIQDEKGQAFAKSLGKDAHYHPLNVTDERSWERAVTFITNEFGRLDILFNNAGITGFGEAFGPQDPEHCALEAWREVHQVNLDSIFLGCKYAIGAMKERGGVIVNMSSRSGVIGVPGAAAYGSSKAAIINHTRSVALHCAQHHYPIRCNAVLPGAILTPLWDGMLGNTPEERAKHIQVIESGIPIGHMGTPEDVAYAVLYLASEESRYMTGATLMLDGGFTAGTIANPVKVEK